MNASYKVTITTKEYFTTVTLYHGDRKIFEVVKGPDEHLENALELMGMKMLSHAESLDD